MDDIEKIKKLNKEIIREIRKHSNLSLKDIRNKSMREMEISQNIKAKKPKIYFQWERGEKIGWQIVDLKFIPEKAY